MGGSVGTRQLFEKINDELKMVMQLAGKQMIEDMRHFKLRHNPYDSSISFSQNELKLD